MNWRRVAYLLNDSVGCDSRLMVSQLRATADIAHQVCLVANCRARAVEQRLSGNSKSAEIFKASAREQLDKLYKMLDCSGRSCWLHAAELNELGPSWAERCTTQREEQTMGVS